MPKKNPPDPIDPEKLRYLESRARAIAKSLDAQLHATTSNRYGFALLLFSFDGSELTWISNANREDMIEALEEILNKWKRGDMTDFPGGFTSQN